MFERFEFNTNFPMMATQKHQMFSHGHLAKILRSKVPRVFVCMTLFDLVRLQNLEKLEKHQTDMFESRLLPLQSVQHDKS
jgi:hypothetical protein